MASVLTWHPSLNKTFKGCEQWWESSMVQRDKLGTELARLEKDLQQAGRFRTDASTLHLISQAYAMRTCLLSAGGETERLAEPLRWSVAFRALDFLKTASRSLPIPDAQPLIALWSSMAAVGPTMLSDWERGRACASYLIDVAHKDMRLHTPETRRTAWGKGTNDAFLIRLFSHAYALPTDYQSVEPMVEPLARLLAVWRTVEMEEFQQAMFAAADYHVSRSKDGTDRNKYEFEKSIDRVYPGELLAVQALRRRDGLPEFQAGHLLVDTPWSIVRDLPKIEPHPFELAVEERLRRDDPDFRG